MCLPWSFFYFILVVVESPAVVTISESGETSARVSWGPLQPDTVTSYYIEYSTLPRGNLQTVTVGRTQNSTLLRNLQPGSTYLVTVTARHASGKQKSMSVKVCTQEGEHWEEFEFGIEFSHGLWYRLLIIALTIINNTFMNRNSYFIKFSSDYPSYPHTAVSS